MNVAFVQTYPVYHDLWSVQEWLALENRDRWMPALLAEMGHDVELWGGAHQSSTHRSRLDGLADYPIRLFETVQRDRRTKFHYSDALVAHARQANPDLFVLKGVDGGVGTRLIRKHLGAAGTPYVFVIGGKCYTRHVPRAEVVFYETEAQRRRLEHPGWRFWRAAVDAERLIRLPKSVDTDVFRPLPGVKKRWDLITVGRLVPRVKSYEALGALSEALRVAVVGGGPAEAELRRTYPQVEWIGAVANEAVPQYLNQARLFVHTSRREFFPRTLVEAAACGVPGVAFAEAIAPDVLPPDCGLRLEGDDVVGPIQRLLQDEARRQAMGRRSRERAVAHWGKRSSQAPLREMMRLVKKGLVKGKGRGAALANEAALQ